MSRRRTRWPPQHRRVDAARHVSRGAAWDLSPQTCRPVSQTWCRSRCRRSCRRSCRRWCRSNARSRRDPWEKRSLLGRAAAKALEVARTVRTLQWGRADRERRCRRLTEPLHAPETSATRNTTASTAAGDQASTCTFAASAASPESYVPVALGVRAMSKATGRQILCARSAVGGMGPRFGRRRRLSASGACAPTGPVRTVRSRRSGLIRRRR